MKKIKSLYRLVKEYFSPPWDSKFSYSKINLLTTFPDFKPHGNQNYETFEPILIKNINETLPTLSIINSKFNNVEIIKLVNESSDFENQWNDVLIKHNTDKSKRGYHKIYSEIFSNANNFSLLEFGLGTNDTKKLSTGAAGKNSTPGAFLFAVKELFPNSKLFGADYDKNILFSNNEIKTYYVDVTDKKSILKLFTNFEDKFDYIIDDSLATQFSALNIIEISTDYLKLGGYLLIENVGVWTLDTWKLLNQILKNYFEIKIFETKEESFVIQLKKIK